MPPANTARPCRAFQLPATPPRSTPIPLVFPVSLTLAARIERGRGPLSPACGAVPNPLKRCQLPCKIQKSGSTHRGAARSTGSSPTIGKSRFAPRHSSLKWGYRQSDRNSWISSPASWRSRMIARPTPPPGAPIGLPSRSRRTGRSGAPPQRARWRHQLLEYHRPQRHAELGTLHAHRPITAANAALQNRRYGKGF